MSNILNMHGKDKEVKFVSVNERTGTLKIFFTDYTFEMVKDVEITKED